MLRRRIALTLLTAAVISGCATFDNTDLVAQVGEAELSQDELERRSADLVVDGRLNADDARSVIRDWIAFQLAERADIVNAYRQGPGESGVACLFVLQAPDADTADGWLGRLDGGETWDDLAAEVAPSTPGSGRIECFPTAEIPAIADELGTLDLDSPYRSVVLDDGSVFAVRMQTTDEVNGFELLEVATFVEPAADAVVAADLASLEIEVSPEYGTFVQNDRRLPILPTG